MIDEQDIFCILVPLLENKPWIRQTQKGQLCFEEQQWKAYADRSRVTNPEIQIWLTIYYLFMSSDVRQKYELNQYRKNNLLRLRKFMNDLLLD